MEHDVSHWSQQGVGEGGRHGALLAPLHTNGRVLHNCTGGARDPRLALFPSFPAFSAPKKKWGSLRTRLIPVSISTHILAEHVIWSYYMTCK